MGVYDILPGAQQVKCWWSEMRDVNFGDQVPGIHAKGIQQNEVILTYSIALREGGYANVTDCRLISVTQKPLHSTLFDKYGEQIEDLSELAGEFGESYLFKDLR